MDIFKKNDLIGQYYILEEFTNQQSREVKLELIQAPDNLISFKFELINHGYFGSVGTTWEGECLMQNNQMTLKASIVKDWNITAVQKEREAQINDSNASYTIDIIRENTSHKLKLNLETRKIIMCKTIKNPEILANGITQEIIKIYKLEEKGIELYPERFWRISSLIISDEKQRDLKENNEFEIICEYNIDFVKEEKRVINNDEIIREHHIGKVIYNNESYEILELERIV